MASQQQEDQIAQVKNAIAALEAQRATLGDSVVDASLAALLHQLADLEGQAGPPVQQRKLLTILFTDVVGSTPISRQLDPEELLDTMDAALKRLARPVDEHGGRVTRFQGDGFKAIFGLPIARENDPEMAVRAGLGILEASREIAQDLARKRGISNFQVRVGINTGLVASGGLTEGEDTIGGEAINLAARMESAAPPGGLLISHNTYRHVRGIFNVEQVQPVAAKGFPEPVQVYLVRSANPRTFWQPTRGVEGIETRMVGRETELKLLQDAMLTAVEDAEGQMVTVLGEAGVGKSRLLYEFQNWLELQPHPVRLYQGRARPETQNLPYALLRDLFAYRFQIQEGDPPEMIREKFEKGMGEAFKASTHRDAGEANTHLVGQLLGIGFSASPQLKGLVGDAEAIRNRALESLVEYFTAACRSAPVAIFLEDVHWADDSSLDAVNFLGRRCQNLPLLIVDQARPNLLERRPHWGEGQLYHQVVHLEPLTKRESRQLVEEILQKLEQVPVSLRELVVSGAEGNPFYIEELVKMLVEQGVIVKDEPRWTVQLEKLAQLNVPSTLTGVLQARLDSLPAEERAVLQQASIVGRVFWDKLVEHLHSRQDGQGRDVIQKLSGLREKEMVFRREESVFANALEYIFKHEVLREVTYETVLKKLRRLYHGWVADWLIEQTVDGVEENNGLIADHLERAGRGELARDYYHKAGEAALGRYANAEAMHYFRRAIALNPGEHERPTLLGGLAEALMNQGYWREAMETWREGITLHQAQGNLEDVAWFYSAMIRSLANLLTAEMVEQSEKALSAIAGLTDNRALGHLLHQAARSFILNGQAERSESLCRQALQIGERLGDIELQADALISMGTWFLSKREDILQAFEQAVELAEENGFLYIAHRAHNNLGTFFNDNLYDYHSSQPHYHRALELARQRGSVESELIALSKLFFNLLSLGDFLAADAKLQELERLSQKAPQSEYIAGNYEFHKCILARMRGCLDKQFEDQLLSRLEEERKDGNIKVMFNIAIYDYVPFVLEMQRYRSWAAWDAAERILNEVILFGEQGRGLIDVSQAEARMSTVYARQEKVKEARRWLERAEEKGLPSQFDLSSIIVMEAKAELAIAEGHWENAIEHYKELLERYTKTGMRWDQSHTLLEMAEIHRMRGEPGDREQALDLYDQAREMFAEIGAPGYVEIVDGRLSLLEEKA